MSGELKFERERKPSAKRQADLDFSLLRFRRMHKKEVDCLECRLHGCKRYDEGSARFHAGRQIHGVGFDQLVHR